MFSGYIFFSRQILNHCLYQDFALESAKRCTLKEKLKCLGLYLAMGISMPKSFEKSVTSFVNNFFIIF